MNRQQKRLMQRSEAREARLATTAATRRATATQERRKRVPPRQFLKEVRQELKKVNWPTKTELVAYTVVVLVSVVVLTSYVFGLDFVFSKAILNFFT